LRQQSADFDHNPEIVVIICGLSSQFWNYGCNSEIAATISRLWPQFGNCDQNYRIVDRNLKIARTISGFWPQFLNCDHSSGIVAKIVGLPPKSQNFD